MDAVTITPSGLSYETEGKNMYISKYGKVILYSKKKKARGFSLKGNERIRLFSSCVVGAYVLRKLPVT